MHLDGDFVPTSLSASSRAHLQALSATASSCPRFDSPVLRNVYTLLSSAYGRAVLGYAQVEAVSGRMLMPYRWTGNGTGFVAMDAEAASKEWNLPANPNDDIQSGLRGFAQSVKSLVDEVCSPNDRICKPGYFDMTVFIET